MGLWRSAEDFEHKPLITGAKVLFWITLIVVVLLAALWGTGVLTAPWKGKGDAYVKQQSADNWVAAQRTFHQQNNDFTADLGKIKGARQELSQFEGGAKPDPNSISGFQWQQQDTNLRTTLTGLTQNCQQLAADYDTNAQSYLTKEFRDAGLPDTLDAAACSK
jgi:hypothetical protein